MKKIVLFVFLVLSNGSLVYGMIISKEYKTKGSRRSARMYHDDLRPRPNLHDIDSYDFLSPRSHKPQALVSGDEKQKRKERKKRAELIPKIFPAMAGWSKQERAVVGELFTTKFSLSEDDLNCPRFSEFLKHRVEENNLPIVQFLLSRGVSIAAYSRIIFEAPTADMADLLLLSLRYDNSDEFEQQVEINKKRRVQRAHMIAGIKDAYDIQQGKAPLSIEERILDEMEFTDTFKKLKKYQQAMLKCHIKDLI